MGEALVRRSDEKSGLPKTAQSALTNPQNSVVTVPLCWWRKSNPTRRALDPAVTLFFVTMAKLAPPDETVSVNIKSCRGHGRRLLRVGVHVKDGREPKAELIRCITPKSFRVHFFNPLPHDAITSSAMPRIRRGLAGCTVLRASAPSLGTSFQGTSAKCCCPRRRWCAGNTLCLESHITVRAGRE